MDEDVSSSCTWDGTAELKGRADWADGRTAGNVLMDPLTVIPDDLELSVMELAREPASFDSLDCLGGGIGSGVWELVLELKSGMSGISWDDGIDTLDGRGDGVRDADDRVD